MNANSRSESQISVCHIASGERWAGAEVQVATLVRALSRRPDVRVCAILTNEGRLADEIRSCGVEAAVFPRSENSFAEICAKAYQFLRGRDVQVLHSHRYKENLLAVLIQRGLGGPRLVRTQHGNPEPDGLKGRLVYAIDRATGKRVDKVVAVSSELERYLRTYLKPWQISVIRNGVDLPAVRSELRAPQAKERLGIAPDAPVIGNIARLDPIKRHDLFLRTAKQIANEMPNSIFVIAGAGNEESNLKLLARELGLAGRVKFLGHQAHAPDVLRALDVLLMTSDNEGLPMVLLEAMAMGAVVVSRKIGGIPEVVRHGEEGILVDSAAPEQLAASCVRVLNDSARREMMIIAARKKIVREFSAETNANGVVALYRSILGEAVRVPAAAEENTAIAGDHR